MTENNNDRPVFRHELKYLINYGDKEIIKTRLGGLIQKDTHAKNGFYKIRSLYFDDYWNSSYEEKLMGVTSRSKFRIRIYDDSDSVINLEKKIKQGNYINKQNARLTREETEKILVGDYGFLLKHENKICREFYIQCVSNIMRPRVIVDYEREPFIFAVGDVRITFDTDVRASSLEFALFDPKLPTLSVLDPDKLVMEVKFTELLPQMIRKALPSRAAELSAVSKYVLCCEKTNYILS
ncbi:MAG TPA: transporter [Clostridiales bacterium]|nr:transporter [Clostridiales bacterium]